MAVATAIALTSLAVGAYGIYTTQRGQKEQAQTAQNVSAFNAQIEEDRAIQVEAETRENNRRARKQAKRIISGQRAKFGASGTLVNVGSPLEVQADSAANLEQRILDQDRRGRQEVSRLKSSAESIRLGGSSIATGFNRQAQGTLLGGGSQLLGSTASLFRSGAIG